MTILTRPVRWFRRGEVDAECGRTLLPEQALELLVLQPSPFCNLNCSYCYLPNRSDRHRMSMATLSAALSKVSGSPLLGKRLSLIWHAGEPMAVPIDWYERALAIVAAQLPTTQVDHHFQTNAVLIDDSWCDFICRYNVQIGVSVDGPAFLHDRQRKTRDGKGTHDKVMRGIERLRAAAIPFHVIAVLTREALDHPDAIFDFMSSLGAIQIGFNIEEVELDHVRSSLEAEGATPALTAFWRRLLSRIELEPARIRVREVEGTLAALRSELFGKLDGNQQNRAGRLLSVASDGTYCYWSPELLGALHPLFGPMALGNVNDDEVPLGAEPLLSAIQHEIDLGVAGCKAECRHFNFCLGGAPVNKLFERNTFSSTETMACKMGLKTCVDEVLAQLDRTLPMAPARADRKDR